MLVGSVSVRPRWILSTFTSVVPLCPVSTQPSKFIPYISSPVHFGNFLAYSVAVLSSYHLPHVRRVERRSSCVLCNRIIGGAASSELYRLHRLHVVTLWYTAMSDRRTASVTIPENTAPRRPRLRCATVAALLPSAVCPPTPFISNLVRPHVEHGATNGHTLAISTFHSMACPGSRHASAVSSSHASCPSSTVALCASSMLMTEVCARRTGSVLLPLDVVDDLVSQPTAGLVCLLPPVLGSLPSRVTFAVPVASSCCRVRVWPAGPTFCAPSLAR